MDSTAVKEVFEHLYSLVETLETKNIAILRFLQDEGIATEEKLAPYLEQAGNASNVKWRDARARMEHLFAPAPKKATEQVPTSKRADAQQAGMQNSGGVKSESAAKREQDGKSEAGAKLEANANPEASAKPEAGAKAEANKNASNDQRTKRTKDKDKEDTNESAKAPVAKAARGAHDGKQRDDMEGANKSAS